VSFSDSRSINTLIVACVEELQSLVTHLMCFTHRKIQPSAVLLYTKMSYMSEHFAYYTLLLCVDPAGTPFLAYSMLSFRTVISGRWFGRASDELLKNHTGQIFV